MINRGPRRSIEGSKMINRTPREDQSRCSEPPPGGRTPGATGWETKYEPVRYDLIGHGLTRRREAAKMKIPTGDDARRRVGQACPRLGRGEQGRKGGGRAGGRSREAEATKRGYPSSALR